MNDLTTAILANHSNIKVEEWIRQGSTYEFTSAHNQRVVNTSAPAMEIQITYTNLSLAEYQVLRLAYEANYSNVFIVDTSNDIDDIRRDVMGLNSSVFAFKDFKFNGVAPQVFNGVISLVTSVFFNYPEYQALHSDSSSYSPQSSLDSTFLTLLSNVAPYRVDYTYASNAIFSTIGQSVRHIKDKNGLRRRFTLHWLINESEFLQLLTFYRKKAGIMGLFGIPVDGVAQLFQNAYIEDSNDYVASGYIIDEELINAMFVSDSLKYEKRLNGLYIVQADIIEVLN
jgi:hypothetical protein